MTTRIPSAATAEGVPASTTRRAVLIGGSATAALAGTAAATLAAIPSWMSLKIEAHREALAAELLAGDDYETHERAFREIDDAHPLEVGIIQDVGPPRFIALRYGRTTIEEMIRDTTRMLTAKALMGHAIPIDLDALRPAMERIREVEAESMAALGAAEAEAARRRVDMDAAEKRMKEAQQRESKALLALCAERPRNMQEAAMRARYLRDNDVTLYDDELVSALIASMVVGEA